MQNSGVGLGLHIGPISLALFLLWHLIRRPKTRHPPSPKSLPFIGNLLSIPSGHEYIAFTKLGEQLESDLIYLEILGRKHIIVNSAEAASEILEKRAALHSDRPPAPMVKNSALIDWPGFIPFIDYNDIWRHYRRIMNNWLNVGAVAQFSDLQEQQAHLFLQRLLNATNYPQPFKYIKDEIVLLLSLAGSLALRLAYGYTPQDIQDPFFKEAKLTFHNIVSAGMQTNFLVNVFPAMIHIPDWFPGTDWKRVGKEYGVQQQKAKTEPYEWLKTQIASLRVFCQARGSLPMYYPQASGIHQPSLLAPLLQDHKLLSGLSFKEKDERLKELGIAMFGGGVETTSNFLISLIAAMVLNPHVQIKAQRELDTILGEAVLPRIMDRERLPYIRNPIYEVLRLYPVAPLGEPDLVKRGVYTSFSLCRYACIIGLPHVCSQENDYRGYNIEKGTIM